MDELEYYMSLPYEPQVVSIPEEKGGGYEAFIPELGRYAACADGKTPEEALQKLEAVKESVLISYLEDDLSIPYPRQLASPNITAEDVLAETMAERVVKRAEQREVDYSGLVLDKATWDKKEN